MLEQNLLEVFILLRTIRNAALRVLAQHQLIDPYWTLFGPWHLTCWCHGERFCPKEEIRDALLTTELGDGTRTRP